MTAPTTIREGRMFPIMGAPNIPWVLIAPFEYQAEANHGQSLERLASRGGLDMGEALAVMTGKKWREIVQPTLDQFRAFVRKREIEHAEHAATLTAIRAAAAALPPEPDEAARLREVLIAMAAELQWTIDFDRAARDRQGLDTSADTHIIAPPAWPTHGALTNQIAALKQAAGYLAPTEAAGG